MKVLLSLLGVVIAALGAYLAYRQYTLAREKDKQARPEVVVCLRSFSYSRTRPQGSGADLAFLPEVRASFTLVNKGGTQVTATKVTFNPIGTWKEGRPGGMGSLEVELNKTLPGNGVATVDDISFVPTLAIADRFWIEKPDAVHVQAHWPGGIGRMLTCIATSGQGWSCGTGSGQSILAEPACQ